MATKLGFHRFALSRALVMHRFVMVCDVTWIPAARKTRFTSARFGACPLAGSLRDRQPHGRRDRPWFQFATALRQTVVQDMVDLVLHGFL